MAIEVISLSISTKVWDQAGIELVTSGYAVRHNSAARHVTDCATQPGKNNLMVFLKEIFGKKIIFKISADGKNHT